MPHETVLFDDGVHWRFSGAVPFSEFVAANGEVWSLPEWDRHKFQVLDLLDAETPVINAFEAESFVSFDEPAAQSTSEMRVAFVTQDTRWVALAQSYIEALEIPGWQARIFDNLGEAMSWARAN